MAVSGGRTPDRAEGRGRRINVHEHIVESIGDAIADWRLPPGAKLTEEPLAQVFGVSRARIRSALATLAQNGVVVLRPNCGAFVACPTEGEGREVLETRRIIERGVLERLIRERPLTAPALTRLRAHLERERAAEAAADRSAMIRLSGDFHLLLAERAGNRLLREVLVSLVRLSSLAIAAQESCSCANCSADEHAAILDALVARDDERVQHLMMDHLRAIEERLDPQTETLTIDPFAVFGTEAGRN